MCSHKPWSLVQHITGTAFRMAEIEHRRVQTGPKSASRKRDVADCRPVPRFPRSPFLRMVSGWPTTRSWPFMCWLAPAFAILLLFAQSGLGHAPGHRAGGLRVYCDRLQCVQTSALFRRVRDEFQIDRQETLALTCPQFRFT